MKKIITPLLILLCVGIVVGISLLILFGNTAVLSPAGVIAMEQRKLIIIATILMLIVIVPVFLMTLLFALKYREGKSKDYQPEWDGNTFAETLWWGIPLLLIIALSAIIIKSSHQLDPFKPIASDKAPVKVQVIALQWKWLFIYPDEDIATVNYLQVPEDTPIEFSLTSDAPMNSFWVPKLGGQVYAMSGMTTKLYLQADEQGSYAGSSANISGEGFADMKFTVRASSAQEFKTWVNQTRQSKHTLDIANYDLLAAPSNKGPYLTYQLSDVTLYDKVLAKYMPPTTPANAMEGH